MTFSLKAGLMANAAMSLWAGAAFAQPAPEHAMPAAVAPDGPGIGDIVVTARRREESAQKVPVSVTAFSGEALRAASVKSLSDLTAITPGIRFSSEGEGNASTVSLRGLSKVPIGETLPAVVVYFNEVALPSQGVNVPTFDLANVQVLKGPQGTLFGRNTIGGAVLLTTQAPTFDFGGYIDGTYGNLGYKHLEGAVNVPLVSDKLAIRLAGEINRRDGYTKDLTGGPALNNIHNESARVSILFKPTDTITNSTVVDYFNAKEQPTASIPFALNGGIDTVRQFFGAQYADEIEAAVARQASIGPYKVYYGIPERYSNRKSIALVNTTRWDLNDDIYIKNIFGFRRSKLSILTESAGLPSADLPGPFGYFVTLYDTLEKRYQDISDELQLQGNSFDNKLNWIVGGIYTKESPYGIEGSASHSFEFSTTPGFSSLPTNYGTQLFSDTSKAVFGQATLDLSDWTIQGLKATGGFRYTWDTVHSCGEGSSASPDATQYYLTSSQCYADVAADRFHASTVDTKDKQPTYTLGLDWQATNRVLLYFVHRKGYRGANVNAPRFTSQYTTGGTGCSFGACPDLRPFQTTKPEKISDFEIGVKTQWRLGTGHGRFNVALYQNKITGEVQFINVTPLGVPAQAYDNPQSGALGINAANLRNRGVEVEGIVAPDDRLTFSFNGAYNKTKVLSVLSPPGLNVGIPEDEVNRPTPELSGTVAVDWIAPIEPLGGKLQLHGDVYHSSSWRPQEGATLPAYDLVNFRLDLKDIAGKGIDAGLWMRNALDKAYITAAVVLVPAFPIKSGNYGEPRTYGIDLRYRF
jgi:iron complex outermembrane receptor protein